MNQEYDRAFLLLLFLLATFDRSPDNLLRLCRLVEKSQRRNRRDLVRENVIENPNEHEPETPIRAGRLRPTKHMSLFCRLLVIRLVIEIVGGVDNANSASL